MHFRIKGEKCKDRIVKLYVLGMLTRQTTYYNLLELRGYHGFGGTNCLLLHRVAMHTGLQNPVLAKLTTTSNSF